MCLRNTNNELNVAKRFYEIWFRIPPFIIRPIVKKGHHTVWYRHTKIQTTILYTLSCWSTYKLYILTNLHLLSGLTILFVCSYMCQVCMLYFFVNYLMSPLFIVDSFPGFRSFFQISDFCNAICIVKQQNCVVKVTNNDTL